MNRVNGPSQNLSSVVENSDYIEGLRIAIKNLHGCDSRYVESVPVTETFQGKTIWNGFVQVFELIGHPKAKRCFAWTHPEGERNEKERFIAVLCLPPVDSPKKAVQAAIVDAIQRIKGGEQHGKK